CAVELNVLAACQLGMEAGAHFEKARDSSVNGDPTGRRLGDPAEDLQNRRFSSAVLPDDPDGLTAKHFERDIPKCPKLPTLLLIDRLELRAGRKDLGQHFAERQLP